MQVVRSVLLFVDDMYEDLELWYPKVRMEEAGFKTVVAAEIAGKTYNGKHGYPCKSDIAYENVEISHFDGLIVPGGYAPDKIRRHVKALEIVRHMVQGNKLIAFICHAGWVAISAKILKGKKVTGFIAIKDDLENAGAIYTDEPCVVDGKIVTSRKPADLPAFCKAILKQLG